MFRLMIIGEMNTHIMSASSIAVKRGAKVTHVHNISSALNMLRNGNGTDLIMAEVHNDIADLIKSLNDERIVVPVIACGTDADRDLAISAIKAGAKDYISVPPDEETIAAMFEAICCNSDTIIGESAAILESIHIAKKIAVSDANILITGESGTGKELFARLIHANSKRNRGPWIALNCAAIPENLIESEMFGHEKGAFTGAIEKRIGKFEEATNGTLFLDEIGEMKLDLQAKLLRAIQEREITPIGGKASVKVNFRLIAASNRNLLEEVQAGRFRADLFYRLNVITIPLPSLAERMGDIPLLAEFFCEKYSVLNGIKAKKFTKAAISKLESHMWPGNIRELENTIHRAVLLAQYDEITEGDIILIQHAEHANTDVIQEKIVSTTLQFCRGDYNKAAIVLGASLRSLNIKLNDILKKTV